MKPFILTILLLTFVSPIYSFDLFKDIFSSSSTATKKPSTIISDEKAKEYLTTFGYVPPSSIISGSGLKADFQDARRALKNAITEFQKFANLEPSGELDTETKQKMSEPRCGVTDVQVQAITLTREAAFKWKKNRLTYAIQNTSPDLPMSDVQSAIRQAFDTWSKVVPLEFTEIPSSAKADIKIEFGSGYHSDPWPFDGKGGILAHATNPPDGKLHFDNDETWTSMDAEKILNGATDLLPVAIHEAGHTLGLAHSKDEESIMAPFYKHTVDSDGNYLEPRLGSSDVQSIQEIYGERKAKSSSWFSWLGSSEASSETPAPSINHANNPRQPSSGSCREDLNKDIIDNNLEAKNGQVNQCCGFCKETKGCRGYVWDDFQGGTCWLKSATAYTTDKQGVIMGSL